VVIAEDLDYQLSRWLRQLMSIVLIPRFGSGLGPEWAAGRNCRRKWHDGPGDSDEEGT
jgi:hypothetical protein